jgi:hypothetical protein
MLWVSLVVLVELWYRQIVFIGVSMVGPDHGGSKGSGPIYHIQRDIMTIDSNDLIWALPPMLLSPDTYLTL